tara:strand:+ start:117 stop:308 length:192 start_codon:yes stop_codon:yes gene_type:complete
MSITYEDLSKVTCNFEDRDFWWWFITTDDMDLDTKVNILDWFMSEFYTVEQIVDYLKDEGIIK